MVLPEFWQRFVMDNALVDAELTIPEELDRSRAGAFIRILDEQAATVEARELFPGMGVFQDGFVPVGGCAIGTGDPYFINVNDGDAGPLYRISHEDVHEDGYDRAAAVEVVLMDYRELLRFRAGA